MVHQRHGVALAHAGVPAAGDEGHPKTVARGTRRFLQHLVVTAFHFTGDERDGALALQWSKRASQLRDERHDVTLLRVRQLPLCISNDDLPLPKMQIAKARLKCSDVLAIRASAGVTQAALGRQYGVTSAAIRRILTRKAWMHI